VSEKEIPDERRCTATSAKTQQRCTAYRALDLDVCAGHSGRYTEAATQASATARTTRTEERKLSALDWAARKLEENGERLAGLIVTAAERGDWRAAAFLYERVHGKPREQVEVSGPDSVDEVRAMSLDEIRQLRSRLLDEHPQLRAVE
jgi:hypothetical protein